LWIFGNSAGFLRRQQSLEIGQAVWVDLVLLAAVKL
jgi:hypothetical protein